MTVTERRIRSHAQSEEPQTIVTRWVTSAQEASNAVHSNARGTVWIVRKCKFAESIARGLAERKLSKKSGQIFFLTTIRSPLLPVFETGFEKVASPSAAVPSNELNSVLTSADRNERFVGGTVDKQSKIVTLWLGDLRHLVVPFDAFRPTANGIQPNFNLFSIADYGTTLKFGDYEAVAEAVLYEFDPEFRRRLKQRRWAEDDSLGASIRRLRMQRQLTRDDFESVAPKTLARIENGQVKNPHAATLAAIAKRLKVEPEDLRNY